MLLGCCWLCWGWVWAGRLLLGRACAGAGLLLAVLGLSLGWAAAGLLLGCRWAAAGLLLAVLGLGLGWAAAGLGLQLSCCLAVAGL